MALIKNIPSAAESYLVKVTEASSVADTASAITSGDSFNINNTITVLISNMTGSFTFTAGTASTLKAVKKDLTVVTLNVGTYDLAEYIMLQGIAGSGYTSTISFSF